MYIKKNEDKLNFFIESMAVLRNLQMASIRNEFLHTMNREDKLYRLLEDCLAIPLHKYRIFKEVQHRDPNRDRETAIVEQVFDTSFEFFEKDNKIC
jgi:hypothetical protein